MWIHGLDDVNIFLIIDTDSMNVKSVSNDGMMASGGAGIQAAQMVTKTGFILILSKRQEKVV